MQKIMTPEQLEKIERCLRGDSNTFVFIPSEDLKNRIINKSDEIINKLPPSMTALLLSCSNLNGISLDPAIVSKYINGTIDLNHKHVFSLGEIRVICG